MLGYRESQNGKPPVYKYFLLYESAWGGVWHFTGGSMTAKEARQICAEQRRQGGIVRTWYEPNPDWRKGAQS